MFGYIQPQKPELKIWEYEQYRAVYCGLCRSMGKHTGQLSRFALNYDYTFLAMLRTALEGITPEFKACRCVVRPIKKRAMVLDDRVLEYCAKISSMLTYLKVQDNISDSRGFKKLAARLLSPACKAAYSRSRLAVSLAWTVTQMLSEMSELEKSPDASPDKLAEIFGEIMSEIFVFGLDDPIKARIAREIGRHTGRYIYLADALDDAERDIRSGEFNPFVLIYGPDKVTDHAEEIKTAVLLELKGLEAAINLVDFSACKGYENIVKNIIYLGMPHKIGSILSKSPAQQMNGDQYDRPL